MGDIGEVTASSLSAHQDVIDMEAEGKRGITDYTSLEADLDKWKTKALDGNVSDAVEGLLAIEKVQRLAEEVGGTRRACQAILEVLHTAGDWKGLNDHILLLSKRRSQLKQAIQALVRQAMTYFDSAPDQAALVDLIRTLQTVTEGKIYVEIERARLTKRLAKIEEEKGNVSEAADILQEVAVETFGAMAKEEKISFILEQVRLCLARKDYIRAQILIRKVSPRAFKHRPEKKGEAAGEVGIEGTIIEGAAQGTPTLNELKLQYYRLYIQYYQQEHNYLEICRCYRAIYDTESINGDAQAWREVLRKVCWYAVLAPLGSEQTTLINLTVADRRLDDLQSHKELLCSFTTQEVLWWSTLSQKYKAEMESQADIFSGPYGEKAQADFRQRVTEHNVLVVAKYYSCITTKRLAVLLDLPAPATEKALATMVVDGAVSAKIDRPAGIVKFAPHRNTDDILNDWSTSISKLLSKVEKATQQISKERMIHKLAAL